MALLVAEFKKFVESIGFIWIYDVYKFKAYSIYYDDNSFTIYYKSKRLGYYRLNDLSPLKRLVNRTEFVIYIRTIGFKYDEFINRYVYKEHKIFLYFTEYRFDNKDYSYNDLTPLKQISRKYKLKKILG